MNTGESHVHLINTMLGIIHGDKDQAIIDDHIILSDREEHVDRCPAHDNWVTTENASCPDPCSDCSYRVVEEYTDAAAN